ncbi:MAG: MarR family transcriptional regulator [Candidatus Micrarchaeia archaeon]
MDNRTIGYLIVFISILIGYIVYSFNTALTDIVNQSCTHGPTCPMWDTIEFQTNIGLGIMVVIILIGLYLIFFSDKKKAEFNVAAPNKQEDLYSRLSGEEKEIIKLIIKSNGAIYQSELVDKTGFGKVRISRLLDKLEGKGLIERRRRGMTNMILLRK